MDFSTLFDPLEVRGFTLRNRLVMPPMATNLDPATPESCAWYSARAGGVALVIVEALHVARFTTGTGDLTAERLAPLATAIHERGALAAVQLFPGRGEPGNGPAQADPTALVAAFAHATRVCLSAGFDGCEAHGAHGFLLNQFAASTNTRTDEYGSDRARLPVEIVAAMREAMPSGLLLYRHTPRGDGYDLEETHALVDRVVTAGADIIHISPAGSVDEPCEYSAEVKRRLGGRAPVIGVFGLGDPSRATMSLLRGRADLIAVGRGLIADPQWVEKVRAGEADKIVRCTMCANPRCFGNLRKGVPIACVHWQKSM